MPTEWQTGWKRAWRAWPALFCRRVVSYHPCASAETRPSALREWPCQDTTWNQTVRIPSLKYGASQETAGLSTFH